MHTKAAFSSPVNGKVAAGTHVAREKVLGAVQESSGQRSSVWKILVHSLMSTEPVPGTLFLFRLHVSKYLGISLITAAAGTRLLSLLWFKTYFLPEVKNLTRAT